MKTQPVWFCPCVAFCSSGSSCSNYLYGKKFKSEVRARSEANRLFRAMNRARLDGGWTIGVGRSFNRDARPSSIAWAPSGDPTIPDLPEVKK